MHPAGVIFFPVPNHGGLHRHYFAAVSGRRAAEEGFMKLRIVIACLFLGLGLGLRAQVVDTTVCDVVKKPASFDGKMVRIKGTVIAGLDEFVITDAADPNCGYPVDAIWLAYPAGSKAKSGPVAFVDVQPARNFTGKYTPVTRTAVTLDKSKDFKQFDSLLSQPHQKGADLCLGCARYVVTATLIGRLDAVDDPTLKRDASGKIISFGGFGNMNAYPARLVLQSVADVTPKEIDYSKNDDATKGDTMQMPPSGGDLYAAIANAQKSGDALAPSAAKDEAVKAAAVYGKQGEHTGVLTNIGTANEASGKDEVLGTRDSPDGILFNCTFNLDRLQGDAVTRAVSHIGEHVSSLRAPKPGEEQAPAFLLESNAWVVTTVTALSSGQKFFTLPGGYLVWDMNWPAAERNDKMESTLKDFMANEAHLSR
jgi:hypothetical protein